MTTRDYNKQTHSKQEELSNLDYIDLNKLIEGISDEKAKVVFTVDYGEEFGGKNWLKIIELRKLLSGFGCRIIQNNKASPQ